MADRAALVLGDDLFPWHKISERGPDIAAALGDGVALEVTTDRERLDELGEFDFLVDYRSDSTLGGTDRINAFVEGGGGYLGLHSAADLTSTHDGDGGIDPRDEPEPKKRELLRGHFVDHPEQSEFGVDVVADHPVTEGVGDFTVFDEPYQLDVDEDAVTVLARMDHPDDAMDDYPVVWVREYGDGRVCYCSLGHTPESFAHDAHRTLLRNAVRWVAPRS